VTLKEQIEFEKYSKFIIICGRCHGSGLEPGSFVRPYIKCKGCNGLGKPNG